ncbi:MAG: hypothetical protein AB7T22_03805 [Calditrichaceae bacterium]
MRSGLVFKFISKVMLLWLLVLSCDELPRDNLLDPKNSSGYRESVVFIEAFVNTHNPYQYNEFTLDALDEIESVYGNRVVIAEYHRNITLPDTIYSDPYYSLQNEQLYWRYVDAADPGSIGVPDVFINGYQNRVQGASSSSAARDRISKIVGSLVTEKNEYTIESDLRINGSVIQAKCRIARLGNQAADEMLLKMILINNYGETGLKRVVDDISLPVTIAGLDAGSYIEKDISQTFINEPDAVIIVLTSNDGLLIYQALKIDL